jgi:hypothetical protein
MMVVLDFYIFYFYVFYLYLYLYLYWTSINQINDDLGRPGWHRCIGKGSRAVGAGVRRQE